MATEYKENSSNEYSHPMKKESARELLIFGFMRRLYIEMNINMQLDMISVIIFRLYPRIQLNFEPNGLFELTNKDTLCNTRFASGMICAEDMNAMGAIRTWSIKIHDGALSSGSKNSIGAIIAHLSSSTKMHSEFVIDWIPDGCTVIMELNCMDWIINYYLLFNETIYLVQKADGAKS